MTRYVPMLATLCVVAACERQPQPPADQPRHALLEGLSPPPTNAAAQVPPRQDTTAATPVLAPGQASALTVLRGGRPFTGTLTVDGRLAMEPGRITVTPNQDSSIALLYRLPEGVPGLRADSGMATLAVTERSGPGGADRQIVLRSGARTLLGEVWQVSAEPVTLDLRNGLRLVQQTVEPGSGSQYTEAPLVAIENGQVVARIPIGSATTIRGRAGSWVVFSEVSHLFTPRAEDAGQVIGGYVLRAWVVGS